MVLGVLLLSGVVLAKDKHCYKNCKGTDRGEQLSGDGGKNKIWGLGGRDSVYGNGAGDTLFGGTGGDEVHGGSGKDYMKGGSGCDRLFGKIGFDTLVDESGGCNGVKSHNDELLGGNGNDTIRAQDGKKDIISGGPGRDTAYADPVDTVKGVEVERCGGGGCDKPPVAVDDKPPVAVDDKPTVEERNCESDPARTIDVLKNDTNDDGGPKTIESVTQPTNGEVTITNKGSDLTYKPVVGYWNDDTDGLVKPLDHFTYTLNGGSTADVDVIVELSGGVC